MKSIMQSHLWPGVPLALGSAALFGLTAPLSKLLLGKVDPQFLAGALYLGAGIGLAVVHLARQAFSMPAPEAPLRRSDILWLATIILFGGMFGPLLLMYGLAISGAASGSLLLNLESLATMGIAWIVLRENVDRRLIFGAAAILAGALVLSWDGRGLSFDIGAALIAAACVAWGIDNNLTRKLSSADPVQIAMYKGIVAGVVNMAIALGRGAAFPSPSLAGAAGVLGFFGVGVSLVLFIRALRHLGTARTGAYFSLAPFIGAVAALALPGETLSWQLIVAGVLMALGLWLHLAERHQHEHVHHAIEHEHAHAHDEHHAHQHDEQTGEPHSHRHRHDPLTHAHAHYPDLHHRHTHKHG